MLLVQKWSTNILRGGTMTTCEHYSTREQQIPFGEFEIDEHIHRTGFIPTWTSVKQIVCECDKDGDKKPCRCLGCKGLCEK